MEVEDCPPPISFDYAPPSSTEILPLAVLSVAAQELVNELAESEDGVGTGGGIVVFQTASIYTWAAWMSISRAFQDHALEEVEKVPFYAVEPSDCPPFTNNTPFERVEVWQRVEPSELDELEGEVSLEDKVRLVRVCLLCVCVCVCVCV